MRFAISGLALVAALGVGACANNPNRPTDTGNMAQPTPQSSGVYGTSRPTGADTGNMALPNQPVQSGVSAAQPETLGNMGAARQPQSSQGSSQGTVRRRTTTTP